MEHVDGPNVEPLAQTYWMNESSTDKEIAAAVETEVEKRELETPGKNRLLPAPLTTGSGWLCDFVNTPFQK